MKNIKVISLGLGIIAIANLAGHYFPPFSLFTSFVYINIITGVVNYPLYKQNFSLTVIYNFLLLLMNDLLIRWYAGGNHDSAGMGWCWLMFHVGLVIAVTIMIVFSFENKSKKFVNSSIVVIGAVISAVFYNFVNSTI
ncbi:MAG TPA: hypothetical protein VFQ50_08385 [Flavobacterium sp.]|nr:hypothetical protein [Flavobacterium sp.]